jgi:hypothetical protein
MTMVVGRFSMIRMVVIVGAVIAAMLVIVAGLSGMLVRVAVLVMVLMGVGMLMFVAVHFALMFVWMRMRVSVFMCMVVLVFMVALHDPAPFSSKVYSTLLTRTPGRSTSRPPLPVWKPSWARRSGRRVWKRRCALFPVCRRSPVLY